jgi:hypothetical protein
MRKPDLFQFVFLYIAVWLFLLMVAGWWAVRNGGGFAEVMLTLSAVNMGMVCINLIGAVFAMNGRVPWRE